MPQDGALLEETAALWSLFIATSGNSRISSMFQNACFIIQAQQGYRAADDSHKKIGYYSQFPGGQFTADRLLLTVLKRTVYGIQGHSGELQRPSGSRRGQRIQAGAFVVISVGRNRQDMASRLRIGEFEHFSSSGA